MGRKIVSLVLGTVLTIGGLLASSTPATAASAWGGTHDGMVFDNHDSSQFEMSSWSNGGMFDCLYIILLFCESKWTYCPQ